MDNLINNSNDGAPEPGIAMTAVHRDTFHSLNEPKSVSSAKSPATSQTEKGPPAATLHSYYSAYYGAMPERLQQFVDRTWKAVSKVWVIVLEPQQARCIAHGPFTTEAVLSAHLEKQEKELGQNLHRIFIIEGVSSWCAATLGSRYSLDPEFFIESLDDGPILDKSASIMDELTLVMDNAIIVRAGTAKRCLRFEALGEFELQIARSHMLLKLHNGVDIAFIMTNEYTGFGESLASRLLSLPERCRRLSEDSRQWLVWDFYKEMNGWDKILSLAAQQLRMEEKLAKMAPSLKRTQQLHANSAMWIELKEQLRVQGEVIETYLSQLSEISQLVSRHPNGEILEKTPHARFVRELGILKRHTHVLDVIIQQTQNLSSLVFNSMAVRESSAISKITWITLVFAPLSLITSIFSMNVRELNDHTPSLWIWVVCACLLLAFTIGVAVGTMAFPKHLLPTVRRKLTTKVHDAETATCEKPAASGTGAAMETVCTYEPSPPAAYTPRDFDRLAFPTFDSSTEWLEHFPAAEQDPDQLSGMFPDFNTMQPQQARTNPNTIESVHTPPEDRVRKPYPGVPDSPNPISQALERLEHEFKMPDSGTTDPPSQSALPKNASELAMAEEKAFRPETAPDSDYQVAPSRERQQPVAPPRPGPAGPYAPMRRRHPNPSPQQLMVTGGIAIPRPPHRRPQDHVE